MKTISIKRALISVSDKTGLLPLANKLQSIGCEIISTGGTAKFLTQNGINVKDVSSITGFPEILGGRVKTLHPKIHGGILAIQDNPEHKNDLVKENILPIDLVVVNLYPFQEIIKKENVSISDLIEEIDIGGVALLRAAAKNYRYVTILPSIEDYDEFIDILNKENGSTEEFRKRMALKAFKLTSEYDRINYTELSNRFDSNELIFTHTWIKGKSLRYGENPHQKGIAFLDPQIKGGILQAEQLHGKEISYNNYLDAEAAVDLVIELSSFPGYASVVIKHSNPCGAATGETLLKSLEEAWDGDPVSAFGSIIAFSDTVDLKTAEFFHKKFVEVICAPDYSDDALNYLKNKSKKLILLKLSDIKSPSPSPTKKIYRSVSGGLLVMDKDYGHIDKWENKTKTTFPSEMKELGEFIWKVTKYVKSNAIALGEAYTKGYYKLLGMGSGQPNRIDSIRRLSIPKAIENLTRRYKEDNPDAPEEEINDFIKERLSRSVLASDAFFPFADSIEICAEYGIRYIIEPGGSIRDNEVIEKADELGISLVFTGMRHFRH